MNGMDETETQKDIAMDATDDPPTLMASPPVETASPTGSAVIGATASTGPWEKVDPWTTLTEYEEADGRLFPPQQDPRQQPRRPTDVRAPLPAADDGLFEHRMDSRMDRMEGIFERLAGATANNRDETKTEMAAFEAKIEKVAAQQNERDAKPMETIKKGQNAVTEKITDIERRLHQVERDPIERSASQRLPEPASGVANVVQPDPWASSRWGAGGPTTPV